MENLLFLMQHPLVLILILIWTLFWKGLALWKSARKEQPYWFIALLIFNTIGILPILYIYLFSEWKTIKDSINNKNKKVPEEESQNE